MSNLDIYNAIVMAGGGMKGFGLLGAMQYMIDNKLIENVKYYSGTSIGAVICYFLAIGYTPIEMVVYIITNNVFDKKSACFWCSCDFDNNTIYIPKTCIKGTYSVYGSFCSPECAAAHLMEESLDHSTKFERYHLLNHIYGKIYNYTKNIKPAPNPYYMLDKFYGNLTIQEYRALLKSDRLFLIVEKPLSRIFPQYYEDNDDFIINNKIIPTNYSSKKPSSSAPKKYNSAVFG